MTRLSTALATGGFLFVLATSVLVALVSYRFVPAGVPAAMDHVAYYLEGSALLLYAHIAVAPLALAVMPFQFMSGLRMRQPGLHRWLGRIYVGAVVVSGSAGLLLSLRTEAGPVAAFGFGALALAWLATTFLALGHALRRDFVRHRRFMLRSAALTFAAVTLRLYLGTSLALGADFGVAYPLISWACWVPNWVVVELWLLLRAPGQGTGTSPAGAAPVR